MSAPLIAITGLIYVAVAISEYRSGHVGLAAAFAGYAFSNAGLMFATFR